MESQAKDLPTKLAEWVRTEGFPFEMRVARAFQNAGFTVIQSDYYEDPETKNHREIDVVAMIHTSYKRIILRVEFVIECKSSIDKPWILFCAEPEKSESPAWIANRCGSPMGREVLYNLAHNKDLQKLPLFRLRMPTGYGLRQAFSKEKDVAYTAMSTIGNASKARSMYWNDHPNASEILEFIFPVIAIEGRLFECRLSELEDVALLEIPYATLLWRNPVTNVIHTHIDVQTDSSIASFATESFESAKKLIVDHAAIILKAREKRIAKQSRHLPKGW